MTSKILKALDFIRLLDETGTLSLTNIAVIIVLWKVATASALDFMAVATLLTVLSTYSFKRFYQRRHRFAKESQPSAISNFQALNNQLAGLQQELETMRLAVGISGVKINR